MTPDQITAATTLELIGKIEQLTTEAESETLWAKHYHDQAQALQAQVKQLQARIRALECQLADSQATVQVLEVRLRATRIE